MEQSVRLDFLDIILNIHLAAIVGESNYHSQVLQMDDLVYH